MSAASVSAGQGISRYVGLPFKPRGRDFSGVDCYGLAALYCREEFGISVDDPSAAYWAAEADAAKAAVFADAPRFGWVEIPSDDVKPGDVLVFRVLGEPVHCGVAINRLQMLHVLEGINSVIESFTGPHWGPRFHKAYRRAERMGA